MKNLFVLPMVALGLLVGTQTINADEKNDYEGTEIMIQDEYIEIAVETLPQPILDAVATDFAGATIAVAEAKSDASEYKLTLAKEGGEAIEVYADAEGNWISE